MNEAVTMNDYIVKAWKRLQGNPKLFLSLQFPLFIHATLLYLLAGWLDHRPLLHILLSLVLYGIAYYFSSGMVFTVIRVRGETIAQCWAAVRPKARELVKAAVVAQLAVLVGLVALVLPGFYIGVSCVFMPWIVMTSEPQPIRSLFDASRALVKERGFAYYAVLMLTATVVTFSIGLVLGFVGREMLGLSEKSFPMFVVTTFLAAVVSAWMQIMLSELFLHRPKEAALEVV